MSNLSNRLGNTPEGVELQIGVFWQVARDEEFDDPLGATRNPATFRSEEAADAHHGEENFYSQDAASNGKNLYVTWGFLEDKVFSREMGHGRNLDDILYGKNLESSMDSSNTFITWNEHLVERQLNVVDGTQLPFLFPKLWGVGTYSEERHKVPIDRRDPETGYYNGKNKNAIKGRWGVSWDENSPVLKNDKELGRIPMRELFVQVSLVKEAFEVWIKIIFRRHFSRNEF